MTFPGEIMGIQPPQTSWGEFLLAWELPSCSALPAQALLTSKEHQTGWDPLSRRHATLQPGKKSLRALALRPPKWVQGFVAQEAENNCTGTGLVDSRSSPEHAALDAPSTDIHKGKALGSFTLVSSQ